MKYLKLSFIPLWLLLLAGAILFQATPVTYAQEGANVYLKEVARADNTVTVEIVVENINDLYGVEYLLTFDPAALKVVDAASEQEGTQIKNGNFLSAEQGFIVANRVDSDQGTISFAMTLLNPAPSASGNGTLGQITFETLTGSATTINIQDIKLVAASLQLIPANVSGLTLNNGQPGAVPASGNSSDFPWWIIGVGIIVVGLLVLGVFMVVGGGKQNAPRRPAAEPVPHHAVRSRPSAFK
jgi:hypothetical protein